MTLKRILKHLNLGTAMTHINRAQLDDVNKNVFDEIWENIIKMGKTARLIGRINVQRLIDWKRRQTIPNANVRNY
jgi:molybdenum cofactor biosynthesis enzyme MoaA